MPVFSYLAYPAACGKNVLIADLTALNYCQVIPAENADLVILVTDTPDTKTEQHLQEQLHELPSLQELSMTFGHADQETNATHKG